MPVCFAFDGTLVAVPVDTVKDKATTDLQRVRNLAADPRATLLVEHWDPVDWSRLWWVRATMERIETGADRHNTLEDQLRHKYSQYEGHTDVFALVLVFRVTELVGWSASGA